MWSSSLNYTMANPNKQRNTKYLLVQIIIVAFICSGTLFGSLKVNAESYKELQNNNTTETTLYQGKNFNINNDRFVHIPEFYSTQSISLNSGKHTNNKDPNLIVEKGRFQIFKKKQSQTKKWFGLSANSAEKTLPVALNQRTGKFVIITGKLVIQTANIKDLNKIIEKYSLKPIKRFNHLKLIFIEADTLDELLEVSKILQQDPKIIRADIEVIENLKKPL